MIIHFKANNRMENNVRLRTFS